MSASFTFGVVRSHQRALPSKTKTDRATPNDSNYQLYTDLAHQWDGVGSGASSMQAAGQVQRPDDREGWEAIAADGWGVFAGGIGHSEYFPAIALLEGAGANDSCSDDDV